MQGMQVLCPGQQCHLPASAALQASWEILLQVTKFLKKRKLRQLLKREKTIAAQLVSAW